MRLINLFVYEEDEADRYASGGRRNLAGGLLLPQQRLHHEPRSSYSIISLRISPCFSVAACGCSDGTLRLAAVPDATAQHPGVPGSGPASSGGVKNPALEPFASANASLSAANGSGSAAAADAPGTVDATPCGWVARRRLTEGDQLSPITCVAWEPSEPPRRHGDEGEVLGYSLLILATTGAGQIVQCLVTATAPPKPPPPAAAPTAASASKGAAAAPEKLEKRMPGGDDRRGMNPFFIDEPVPMRTSKKGASAKAPSEPTDPVTRSTSAAAPKPIYSIAEVWRHTIPQEQLLCCAYSNSGDAFAVAGRGRTVYVFDATTKALSHSLSRAAIDNPLLQLTLSAAAGVAGTTGSAAAAPTATTKSQHVEKQQQPAGAPGAAAAAPGANRSAASEGAKTGHRAAAGVAGRTTGAARGGPAATRTGAGATAQAGTAPARSTGAAASAPAAAAPAPAAAAAPSTGVGPHSQRPQPTAAARPMPAGGVGASEHHAHGNRIIQLTFLPKPPPKPKHSSSSSKKHQLANKPIQHTLLSCGVDSTIHLWNTERQLAVGGTSECSPLGESLVVLSPTLALVGSHRDDRQLMLLKLPELDTLQVLDANVACSCGGNAEAPRAIQTTAAAAADSQGATAGSAGGSGGNQPMDEGQLTTQFYCCRVAELPEGRIAVCGGGNRHQLRAYLLPTSLDSPNAPNAPTNSNACPCTINAFHMFGLENLNHPPLTVDICRANPPPPVVKKRKQQEQQQKQQPEPESPPGLKQSTFMSTTFAPRNNQAQQQQQEVEEEEEAPPQPVISGVVLAAVQEQVWVFGVTAEPSDLNPEFARLRQQLQQRRSDEALEAAAAARVLQAHAAAAAADSGAGAGDTRKANAHDKDDDDRIEDDRQMPTALAGLSNI